MKSCPRCNKQYQDPSLNFCLDDGTPLIGAGQQGQDTVVMHPPQTAFGQPQATAQPTWNLAQGQQKPARSSASKVLLWVGGILGALVLLCGGGIAGLVYLGKNLPAQPRTGPATTPTAERGSSTTPTPSNSTTSDSKGDVTKAQYDAIKVGMDRKEVEKIMGSAGEEYYSGVGGGVSFVSVKWVGQKFKTIFVSYRDNKVTSKTQVGLDTKM